MDQKRVVRLQMAQGWSHIRREFLAVVDSGGVGIGYSLHAGQVIVADGTEAAAKRISRVLTSDPAMGVLRHADAGYDEAIDVAKTRGVKIPGITI